MMSYLLIQHWCSRVIATLASTKSLAYNKLVDVVVLLACYTHTRLLRWVYIPFIIYVLTPPRWANSTLPYIAT